MTDQMVKTFLLDNPLTKAEVETIYTFVKNVKQFWYPDIEVMAVLDDLGDLMDILVMYYE